MQIKEEAAATVMLTSKGYPQKYEKGMIVSGIENVQESIIFHAGTKQSKNNVLTNGGRVMSITSFGKDIEMALERSFNSAEKINFKGKYYRNDIGADL